MLLEILLNWVLSVFFSILSVFDVNFVSSITFPLSYFQVFTDFLNVAFWFLPSSVLPIFIITPAIWGLRISLSVIHSILDLTSKTPFIGWLS